MRDLRPLLQRPGLYWRTVSHLRPEQLFHRVKLRTLRAALQHQPATLLRAWSYSPASPCGWPAAAQPLDALVTRPAPSAEANGQGRFSFLGAERALGSPPDWMPEAPLLWRYNLHYWEWGWDFAAHADRSWARDTYTDLWQGWCASSPFGSWPAWAPYPVSLRTWAWCGQHDLGYRPRSFRAGIAAEAAEA